MQLSLFCNDSSSKMGQFTHSKSAHTHCGNMHNKYTVVALTHRSNLKLVFSLHFNGILNCITAKVTTYTHTKHLPVCFVWLWICVLNLKISHFIATECIHIIGMKLNHQFYARSPGELLYSHRNRMFMVACVKISTALDKRVTCLCQSIVTKWRCGISKIAEHAICSISYSSWSILTYSLLRLVN